MDGNMMERLTIREVVENWVVWRDAGDWDRFRGCWHDDGVMMATWFQGPAEEFIRVSKEASDRGVSILHFLGGDRKAAAVLRKASRSVDRTLLRGSGGCQGSRFLSPCRGDRTSLHRD
jgi:hypothetical protein